MVDGLAALISLLGVLLIAYFGEQILGSIQQFKAYLFGGIALLVILSSQRSIEKRRRAHS